MAGPNIRHNRFLVVRKNGKKIRIPLKVRAEAPASVYFGVLYSDGVSVFMPRAASSAAGRNLDEVRAHAARARGLTAEAAKTITPVVAAIACAQCARSIPAHSEGSANWCPFSLAVKGAADAKAKASTAPAKVDAAPSVEKKEAK